jgi:hypothetical protein
MLTTGEPEADALLPVLTAAIAAALEPLPRLLGLYLYGSLATGDFTPGVSDIDLLAVTDGPITQDVIDSLRPMHAEIEQRFPGWHDRIEVIYVPRHALATFRTQVSDIGVISPGEPLHILSAGINWLMNWHQVRHGGLVVAGPPAETYVPDTTLAEYVTAVRDHAAAFGDWMPEMREARQQSYAILTLCRALLEQALRWREVAPDDAAKVEQAYPETLRFVQEMQAAIAETS